MHVWKTLKLFISSTFRDLELERDTLAKIFSDMQENLTQRHLSLIPYDLRWRQKHSEKSIVRWCIEMVQQCQYFVGILGDRYGWRPEEDAYGKKNSDRLSVTEMEIQEALNSIEPQRRFFCFVASNKKSKETEQDRASLENLKQRLRQQGETIYEFEDSQKLLEYVKQKLQEIIDADYPPGQVVDNREISRSEATKEIIQQKTKGFVGRTKYLQQVVDFAEQNNAKNYLLVHSVAGIGKSSFLAKFIEYWEQNNTTPVIKHFMTMGSKSRELQEIMLNIAEQLKQYGILQKDLALDPAELKSQVREALENGEQKFLLVIDAIDEIEETAKSLTWLPKNIPSQVRLIISTRPVGLWETLLQYPNIETFELPKLNLDEIIEIISHYNSVHSLNLTKGDQEILQNRAEGNPLYLKVALEEILSSGIAVGELATSVNSLFEQILRRLQKIYGDQVIIDYLGLICASRFGLTESELRELLLQETTDDLLLGVTKSLENFLIQRGGVILFFHSEFERTLKQRLGRKEIRSYHKKLAQYFAEKGLRYQRTLNEMCYQQQWGEEYELLLKTLSDFSFLDTKCQKGLVDDLARDFFFALNSTEVPLPRNLEINISQEVSVSYHTLSLIERALSLDLGFIRRNNSLLFQCLWNRCYWYDCPEIAKYNSRLETITSNENLYLLAEKWRTENTCSTWIKSLKPMEPHLDSPIHMVLPGHQREVIDVAYSHNDRYIASGGEDKILSIWNVETGECIQRIDEHQEHVHLVAFSPDSKKLVSISRNLLIFIWDSHSGECLQIIDAPRCPVTSTIFLDNTMLVIGLEDGTLHVYDVDTGKLFHSFMQSGQAVTCLDVSKNSVIAAGYKDGNVGLWDVASRQKVGFWKAHSRIVNDIAINSNSALVATGAKDTLVKIWNSGTMKCSNTLREHSTNLTHVAFSKDDKKFISVDEQKSCIWDTNSWTIQREMPVDCAINTATTNPNFSMLLCGSKDGTISLWNLNKAQSYLCEIDGHSSAITQCSADKSNRYILTSSLDKDIRIWNTQNGICEKEMKDHLAPVLSATFNKDAKRVVSADEKGNIKVWNVTQSEVIKNLKGHKGIISHVFFHTASNSIVSVGFFDNTLRIWDITSGKCLHELTGHEKWIEDVAFCENGRWIATASRDTTLRIWDIATGQCKKVLRGHEKSVTRVTFCNDNKTLASGSYNGAIHVWDAERGSCLIVLREHNQSITGLAFSEDGKQLISHSRDKTTRIWDFLGGQCIEKIEGIANIDDLKDRNSSIFAVMKDWETVFMCKNTKSQVAAWADRINARMLGKNKIFGTSESLQRNLNVLKIIG